MKNELERFKATLDAFEKLKQEMDLQAWLYATSLWTLAVRMNEEHGWGLEVPPSPKAPAWMKEVKNGEEGI